MKITKEQKAEMRAGIIGVDKIKFHKDGSATAICSYYYRFGMTPEGVFAKIKKEYPTARMIECGDHMHGFVGGAKTGSAQDSYMWAKFDMED